MTELVDPEWVQALLLLLAGIIAGSQVLSTRATARKERTLQLHREWADGSVGGARQRLSALMAGGGEGKFYPLDWDFLIEKSSLPLSPGRAFASDDGRSDVDRLFSILWFFERLGVASKKRVVDRALVSQLFGRDIAWWAVAVRNIDPGASHLLEEMARLAEGMDVDPALRNRVRTEFRSTPRPFIQASIEHEMPGECS